MDPKPKWPNPWEKAYGHSSHKSRWSTRDRVNSFTKRNHWEGDISLDHFYWFPYGGRAKETRVTRLHGRNGCRTNRINEEVHNGPTKASLSS